MCMRTADNAMFWVVRLDRYGIDGHLDYWFRLSIIIAQIFNNKYDFYAHISQRAWTGHFSFKLIIPLNG